MTRNHSRPGGRAMRTRSPTPSRRRPSPAPCWPAPPGLGGPSPGGAQSLAPGWRVVTVWAHQEFALLLSTLALVMAVSMIIVLVVAVRDGVRSELWNPRFLTVMAGSIVLAGVRMWRRRSWQRERPSLPPELSTPASGALRGLPVSRWGSS